MKVFKGLLIFVGLLFGIFLPGALAGAGVPGATPMYVGWGLAAIFIIVALRV